MMVDKEFLVNQGMLDIEEYFFYIAKHIGERDFTSSKEQIAHLSVQQKREFADWIIEADLFESLKYHACRLIIEAYPVVKKPEKQYFLFGLDAINHLQDNDNDYQSLIDDNIDFELYEHDSSESNCGANLLNAMELYEINNSSGWICLSNDEYQLLNQ